MSDHLGVCVFCGNEVTSHHTPAYKVSGWEITRAKGLNALFDKKREPNVIAHSGCLKSEQMRGQGSLLGDAA